MVTLSTAQEQILKSDRIPVFIGANNFVLKKGLQSTSKNKEIPNEVLDEQGNVIHRSITTNSPQISMSFEDLNVDLDMEQILSNEFATIGDFYSGVFTKFAGATSGLIINSLSPTDKITKVVMSYVSGIGTNGYFKTGVGAPVVKVSSNTVSAVDSGDIINFRIGDSILLQENGGTLNVSTSNVGIITNISGSQLVLDTNVLSGVTPSGTLYAMINDTTFPNATDFRANGIPNTSTKGIEVFNFGTTIAGGSTSTALVDSVSIVPAGTVEKLDSNDWRGNVIDALLLYNDYNNDLIYSEYIQDLGNTGATYNGVSEGNATTSFEFNTGKSMIFVGYINRRATINTVSGTSIDLSATKSGNILKNSEVPIAIETNGTFNDDAYAHYFLKVVTISPDGKRTVWSESDPDGTGTIGLGKAEYRYTTSTTTVHFGSAIPKGSRVEFTYLCDASLVADADAYKFDEDAFDRNERTPATVTGKYQPIFITTSNIDSATRTDGIESSTISLSLNRDFYNAQGIASQKVKPGDIGTVEGSFNSWEGYANTINLMNTGNYSALTANQQIDAYKSAVYTSNNTVPLLYRLYDPKDNTTILKNVEVDGIQATSEDNSVSVGDDATRSYNYVGKTGRILFSR